MDSLLRTVGQEIRDVDEETFHLFSQSPPSQDLGMLDPRAGLLQVTVAGRDFEIIQSPGLLQSRRDGGTTGAAVWQSAVRCAEWVASDQNVLRRCGLLHPNATLLELGAGISGLVPHLLQGHVRRAVSTDQPYVLKTLKQNLAAHEKTQARPKSTARSAGKHQTEPSRTLDAFALDWETDDARSVLRENGLGDGADVVLACDCIYNYALVDPLVQTCRHICSLRRAREETPWPTVCVVVQQLRQPDVFQHWLAAFHHSFHVWRLPSAALSDDLQENSGFAVHVGVVRAAATDRALSALVVDR